MSDHCGGCGTPHLQDTERCPTCGSRWRERFTEDYAARLARIERVLGGEWFYGYGMQGLHGKDQTWLLAELRERDRQLAEAQEKAKHYYNACVKMEHEVTQVLGKALGYPEYGPEVFENGQPDGSVCVGEHVAESIADEAARRIKTLEEGIRSIECRRCANTGVVEHIQFATETSPTYRHRSPCPVCGKARVALKKEILGE